MKTVSNNVERNHDHEIDFNASMIQPDSVKLLKKEDSSRKTILKSFEYGEYCIIQIILDNHIKIYLLKARISEINLYRIKPIAEFQHANNGWSDAILYLFTMVDKGKGV